MAEIDMAEFEGAGERYKFLIQPVKDLAANWDLDIAKTLEDYIRKVVEDTNRFDADFPADEHRQHKVFNFAEAALLIHGTTTVYARKVEYVLQRAQSFFDQLREDENIHQQQQRGKRRKANDTLEQGAQGEEEGTDENGNANDAAGVQERRQPKISYASLGHLLDRLSRRRSSLLPFVPIAFFPFTDFEKKDVSLRTRTDPTEVFGKKEDFRLNSCHIHGSVALLDFKNISIINKFSQLAINSQKKDANFVALEPLMEQTEDDFNDALSCGAESTADTLQRQTNQQQETERRGTGASAPTQLRQIDFVAEEIINLPQDEVWDNELEQTDHQKLQNIPQLEFLDPYQRITDQSQPLRRKQNCVMNAIKQITARTHRIKRDCLEKGVPNVSTIKCYIETRIFRRQLKKRAYTLGLFNSFIADQAVLALNPLIHEEEKRRSELRKKRRKEIQNAERVERFMRRAMQDREVDPVLEHPAGSDEEQADDEGDAEQIQDDGEIDEFDDPMDELVAEEIINLPQDEVWDNELEQNDHQNLGDILEVEDLENSFGRMQNLYAGFEHLNTLQRKRAKSLVAQCNFSDDTIFAGGVINSDDLPPRPISQMDYDEIIAFHLRKYWTASEQVTSAFSERIQKWEKRMTEVLEQEHLRREFCTSIYGDELLERFGGQINSELDFTKMLAELPNDYDRSRFLLVALILANMGNVHILTDEDDGEKQIIRLRLLSLKKQEFSL